MTIFSSSGSRSSSKKLGDTPVGSGSIPTFASSGNSFGGSQISTPAGFVRNAQAFAPEKTGPSPTSGGSMASAAQLVPSGRCESTTCLLDQKPESMVAETLKMKGELEFTRLLRVDGRFEGELITDNGSLVVGPKGEVVGDLKNMKEVYVEGIVRGNVFAEDVKVKNSGMLLGDIQCLRLTLDPTASVKGVADTATLKERTIMEANAKAAAATATARSTSDAKPTMNAPTGNGAPAKTITSAGDETYGLPSRLSDAPAAANAGSPGSVGAAPSPSP